MTADPAYSRRELGQALGLAALLAAVACGLIVLLGGSPALLVPALPAVLVVLAFFNPAAPVVSLIERRVSRVARSLRRAALHVRRRAPRSLPRPVLEPMLGGSGLRGPPSLA